ncbi:MAG: hypothetical protein G01um101429_1079 [Parcubacteria group bacterium Gr01-1014_29]|nr:MAG: hypothetical protein G01um101429_1079 [Parcubacteria group bacterium Gr01-1014_29]
MSRSNPNPFSGLWSVFSAWLFVHLRRQSTPRHPPRGCFRYGYERLDSSVPPYPRTPSLRVGSSGRLLFGERKESSPQLGLLLVPSESALRTTPLLVFIRVFVLSLSLLIRPTSMRVGARPSPLDAKRKQSRGKCKCLPQVRSKPSGLLPPVRAGEDSLQIFEYTTPCPVLPTCRILPSFSSADKYLVAVASETCRSFSTSSLVILFLVVSACIILSRFFRLRS